MSEATLVFPFQLFDPHPALERGRKVVLIEDLDHIAVRIGRNDAARYRKRNNPYEGTCHSAAPSHVLPDAGAHMIPKIESVFSIRAILTVKSLDLFRNSLVPSKGSTNQ